MPFQKVLVKATDTIFEKKMSDPNFLFQTKDIVMKKKILSVREHYDFEDINGNHLGAAEANIIQVPPKFVVTDNHGQELMKLEGKMVSFRSEFAFFDDQGVELGIIQKKNCKVNRRRILAGKKRR